MKFATDLNKGILGSPDSTELWQEITGRIPDKVLLKPKVRILVVACGHCTEAVILARRMMALGVSKKAVQDSIWLIDKYQVFTNPAKNVFGFKNVVTADFLEWNAPMRFDVLVGNPPFQQPGSKNTIYQHFYNKALDIADIVALVTPKNMMDSLVKENCDNVKIKKVIPSIINFNNIESYFNVSSTFCYFVIDQTKQVKESQVIFPYGKIKVDPTTVMLSSIDSKEKSNFVAQNFTNPGYTISTADAGSNEVTGKDVIVFDTIKNGKPVNKRTVKMPAKRFNKDPFKPKVLFPILTSGKKEEAYLDLKGNVLPSDKHLMAYIVLDTPAEAQQAYDALSSATFNEFAELFKNRSTLIQFYSTVDFKQC
jgi:hypothetical protein